MAGAASELEYLPVGFGAHHWRVVGSDHVAYFLALHDLEQPAEVSFWQLGQALESASSLRRECELAFVLAPIRSRSGSVVHHFAEDRALVVYPWLTCRPRGDLDTPDVGQLRARLHASTCHAGPALATYRALTSTTPDEPRLRLYRAWYHLAETAVYVRQFRLPHRGDLNDVTAWNNFRTFVPVYRGWPELDGLYRGSCWRSTT